MPAALLRGTLVLEAVHHMMNKTALAQLFEAVQLEVAGYDGQLQSVTLTNHGNVTNIVDDASGMVRKEYGRTRIGMTARVRIQTTFEL